jgi:hypothetical protein
MRFELKFKETQHPFGIQAIHRFDNGYGVSVIRNNLSMGATLGLFEIALLNKGDDIQYDQQPIPAGVLGCLKMHEVQDIMSDINDLTPEEK